MYRVKKALNHNAVVAIDAEKCQEFLILGKGIGFGKKVTEYVEPRAEDIVYSMKECTERGEAEDIVNEVSPVCLQLRKWFVCNCGSGLFAIAGKDCLFCLVSLLITCRRAKML